MCVSFLRVAPSVNPQLGLDVIYGDTDSVMINSHTHSLSEAQGMAQRYKLASSLFSSSPTSLLVLTSPLSSSTRLFTS